MEEKLVFVDIYIGEIFDNVKMVPLYPATRWEEILSCKNERVRRQKYCVWKLLGYALKHSFNREITDFSFEKLPTGKWKTTGCCFSLSHTGKLAAVAIANANVGVDVEKGNEKLWKMADKILTEREKVECAKMEAAEKEGYLLRLWSVKESVFKAFGTSGFVPRDIDSETYSWSYGEMEFDGDKYVITASTEGDIASRLHFANGYLEEHIK